MSLWYSSGLVNIHNESCKLFLIPNCQSFIQNKWSTIYEVADIDTYKGSVLQSYRVVTMWRPLKQLNKSTGTHSLDFLNLNKKRPGAETRLRVRA